MHQLALHVPGRWRRRRDFGCCSASSAAPESAACSSRPWRSRDSAAAPGAAAASSSASQPGSTQGFCPLVPLLHLPAWEGSARTSLCPGGGTAGTAGLAPPTRCHRAPKYHAGAWRGTQRGRNCCPRRCQQKARLAATCPRAVRRAGQPHEAGSRRCPSLTPLQQSLFSPKPALPPARSHPPPLQPAGRKRDARQEICTDPSPCRILPMLLIAGSSHS